MPSNWLTSTTVDLREKTGMRSITMQGGLGVSGQAVPCRRALALLELAELHAGRGSRDDARRAVTEAASIFLQLGASFDLARAEALRSTRA